MLTQKLRIVRSLGLTSAATLVLDKLIKPTAPGFDEHWPRFEGKGLEIGGPSRVFSACGYWPVYACADRIDNVNFRATTEWHGTIDGGDAFRFAPDKAPGVQYIRDAGELTGLDDGSYDFVLSSHMLEHSANPIKVLLEWMRILRPQGVLQLVLPHKDGTFDHRRPVTSLEHLREDHASGKGEDDPTHLDEILELHDLARDTSQASAESFRRWIVDNANNRGAHQHVFTTLSAVRLLDAVGLQVLYVQARRPYDIFLTAQKTDTVRPADNAVLLSKDAHYLRSSPFASDRRALG